MKKSLLALTCFAMATTIGFAQVVTGFEVALPVATHGMEVPVSLSLKNITSLPAQSLSLVEVNGDRKTPVPFQLSPGREKTITWLAKPGEGQHRKTYELIKGEASSFPPMDIHHKDGALIIGSGNSPLLSYYYRAVYPPAGIDSAFRRSGFIHPLWTPHGQVLTRIQPPDHYHHYGIWNPWTHTLFEKDTVDFWNIGGKQATVRFAKTLSEFSGNVYSEFTGLLEHVVFSKEGGEKIAIKERQTIRVYKPQNDYYTIDFTSELTCGTKSPITLLEYRYGGLGWRATEFWDKNNCEVLTSEGNTRKNTDASRARWCMAYGDLPGSDSGGLVMMSYPSNYNHPEPLRIWDITQNRGRGDMFVNFSPTKDKDWLLEPGKKYVLKYRFVVFNGKLDADKAESAWQYFAKPPNVTVTIK